MDIDYTINGDPICIDLPKNRTEKFLTEKTAVLTEKQIQENL